MIYLKLIIFTLFISCNANNDPGKLLKSFEQNLAQGKVSKFTAGEWLTDDALNKYDFDFGSTNRTYLKKLTINYTNCLKEICSFTYDVSYKIVKNGVESQMDVRKQAVLRIQENQRWLIDEIDIIKSYIDNKNTIKI